MQCCVDWWRQQHRYPLGGERVLLVSRAAATVPGYTLVQVRYNEGPDMDLAAASAQLYGHCRRHEVSLRVESGDDSRLKVGVFVHLQRRATVPYGVWYELEFERRGRAGSRIEHLVAIERALESI